MNIRVLAGTVALAVFSVLLAFAADEITTMNQLSVTKGYLSVSKGVDSKATMYGNAYDQKVTTFDTNELNVLTVSSTITTAGVGYVRNMSTNCAAIVTASFQLMPGETVMGRLLSTNVTIYCSTNNALGIAYGIITNVSGSTTNIYTNTLPTTVDVESILIAQ